MQAVNVHDYIQERAQSRPQEEPTRYCVQELFLPDCELIHMRLMLASWELGLKGAEQNAAEILVVAVQVLNKYYCLDIIQHTVRKVRYSLHPGLVLAIF